MRIGTRDFDTTNHTYIMGILNVTPDSFSDGGRYDKRDKALKRVEELIDEGADIIDIGGESTRPGYTMISAEEEIERVLPVIKEIKSRFDIPLSLDTYKSQVAQAGLEAGVDMINDIWGLRYDSRMAEVIAKSGAACCLMHNRKEAVYVDFMAEVIADLSETVEMAEKAGIAGDKIMLDGGVGFGKSYEQNLQLLYDMEELHSFGYPLLLAASRKSVVGNALNLPAEERLEGTLAIAAIGVMKGCAFLRVHDVRANKRAAMMAEAIRRQGQRR